MDERLLNARIERFRQAGYDEAESLVYASDPSIALPRTPVAPVAIEPPVWAGPHVTERPSPPASHTRGVEEISILSASHYDREILRREIGDIAFAQKFRRELQEGNVRVRWRPL